MTQQQIAVLELFIMGGLGLAFIIAGLITHMATKSRNNRCKYASVGKVVDYYYKGEMRVGPIVEFKTREGATYRTKKTFEGYKSVVRMPVGQSDIWEGEDGYLHTRRGMTGRWRECAEKLWPIGSDQAVYYDPVEPQKRNYVERPLTNKFVTKAFVLTGIGITVLSVVMFFVIVNVK